MTLDAARSIARELEAAKSLLANIRDVIADDDAARSDAIEGETNLIEAIESAVARVFEIEAFDSAIGEQIKTLTERRSRFARQAEHLRQAVLVAMGQVELRKLELSTATLSRKAVPQKVEITSEADVPVKFWKAADPRLDRKAVLEALKSNEPVPGACLSNGGETLSIRGN